MKILIADKVSTKMVEDLKSLGFEVTINPDVSPADLAGVIGSAEILIVRSKQVTAATIDAAAALSSTPSTSSAPAKKASTSPTALARTPTQWPSWRSAC